ncbi:MAG TPA: hypothetical protein PK307_15150 [Spirochaetota bacterium]|nr:hypothetical protein [Spirochaetota bacterium]HOD15245.1 hypothetical protein [Spirochaetota bacterium]HPG49539.1 hypothetical protein [Spirochaetota bacterium]HPN12009.1 hypothetical protein [Spirochaetota bacterium]HQL83539.1 hypothetical protein [Spirochaetota bacterium]
MNIDLTKNDVDFIKLLLERELKSTMVERHHTTMNEYKEFVKAKETQIEHLIEQFKSVH